MLVPDVSVETLLRTSSDVAYELVSDVTRMGQWSPETTSCRWLDGTRQPAVGARFRGHNRRGWFRWTTTCTVLVADSGKQFAFKVRYGPMPMARWDYTFAAEQDGCRVTESWTELRPAWLRRIDPVVFRIPDRSRHNRITMEATLAQLAHHVDGR
jgi:hypothetical protein